MIDYSRPASDGVFDGADFEKFLHDRIKVEGKAGQLGDNVKIVRDGMILSVNTHITTFLLISNRQQQTHCYLEYPFLKTLSQVLNQKVLEEEHSA